MLKELLISLLKEASITPDAKDCFRISEEFLSDFDCVYINRNDTKNQILSKTFNKNGIHFAFCGHCDVVPPGNGWLSDPFAPLIKDDLIIARGAQDMKSGVAAFLYAVKKFCEQDIKNIGKISIILTSDEEGDGLDGTILALQYLKDSFDLPNLAIVAEPTSEKSFGDSIKVGRRGSIHASIKIKGKQGHVAYPNKCINPVHLGANALAKIADAKLDVGDEFFEPSRIIITNLQAGIGASNVTPSEFLIKLNVRNSPKSTKEDLENFLKNALEDLDYELEINQSSEPFFTNTNTLLIKSLIKALEEMGIKNPSLNAKGGTSDARILAAFGVDVAEIGVCNDKIHAANESVDFKDVKLLAECFLRLLNILEGRKC